jgi:predicted RND superfamily exporter protein
MIYTINQINDGKSEAITARDLNNYVKKVDSVDKTDYESLKLTVANKLDKSPEHSHTISAITQLQQQLDDKLSKSTLYSYNSIISDIDQISHINNLNVDSLTIGDDNFDVRFMTEQNQQSIAAKYDEIISYIHDQTTQIDNIQSLYYEMKDSIAKINESITSINAVLENHKEVITQLCTKCGIELDNEQSSNSIADNDNNDIDEVVEDNSN